MKSKLFGSRFNVNETLFRVETQEGSEILGGDEGTADIGDASMNHIQNLSSIDRMAHDEFIHMGNGNIFSLEESRDAEDSTMSTPGNQKEADEKIAVRMTSLSKIDAEILSESEKADKNPKKFTALFRQREVVEEELDLLEAYNADDLMGHRESLIPYEDWEKFGGMSQHWDIPSTPKPKLNFAGNSSQSFYDDFPEDHPMASFVNGVIANLDKFEHRQIVTRLHITQYNQENRGLPILNLSYTDKKGKVRPGYMWSDSNKDYLCVEDYAKYIAFRISKMEKIESHYRFNTASALSKMIISIGSDEKTEPAEYVQEMLRSIEQFHFSNYKLAAAVKTRNMDPLFAHLCVYGRQLILLAKKGKNVYNELKAFGKELFENGFLAMKEFKIGELCRRSCKGELGCTIREPGHLVSGVFAIVQHPSPGRYGRNSYHWEKYQAIKKEVESLLKKRTTIQPSEVVQKCVDRMQKIRDEAIQDSNLRKFTSIASSIIVAQKNGKLVLAPAEWAKVWSAYDTCKQEVTRQINRGQIER